VFEDDEFEDDEFEDDESKDDELKNEELDDIFGEVASFSTRIHMCILYFKRLCVIVEGIGIKMV